MRRVPAAEIELPRTATVMPSRAALARGCGAFRRPWRGFRPLDSVSNTGDRNGMEGDVGTLLKERLFFYCSRLAARAELAAAAHSAD